MKKAIAAMKQKKDMVIHDIEMFPEQNPWPVIRMSEEGEIIYINKAGKQIFESMDITNRKEDHLSIFRDITRKALKTLKTHKIKVSSGGNRHFMFFAVPIPNKAYVNLYGTEYETDDEVNEVHREKNMAVKLALDAATQLSYTQNELDKSRRLANIGSLAASIAHELRNPLAVITTALYNVQIKRTNTGIDSHLMSIEKSLDECTQIINNILNYARIKKPILKKVLFSDIVTESVAVSSKRFNDVHADIEVDIKGIDGLLIPVDGYQIKEVLINVINNAYQALGRSDGHISVKSYVKDDKYLMTDIEDNGSGIKEEDIKNIFDPFFSTKSRGSGLGLSICSEIVDMHKGHLEVRSQHDKGTNVSIILPLG